MPKGKRKRDPDATLIVRAPDLRRRSRKRKGRRDAEKEDDSISALAEEFLQQTQGTESGKRDVDERTRVGADTQLGKALHPIKAGLLSIFVWGSGYLYVGHPILASVTLLTVLISATLLLALSGLTPPWFGERILRDLGWQQPLGPSLVVVSAILVVAWWSSLVIPVFLARRSLARDFRPAISIFSALVLSPVLIVHQYARGKFWRGHFAALALFLFMVSFVSTIRLWHETKFLTAAEALELEAYFRGFLSVTVVGFVGVLMTWAGSLLCTLRDLGWLEGARQGVYAEKKFVALGLALVMTALLYVFLGKPGVQARVWGQSMVVEIKNRGYTKSASDLKASVDLWEQKAGQLNDYLSILR